VPDSRPTLGRPQLSSLLDCWTSPAILVDRNRRILAANQPYRERFADGGSVIGTTCHRLSHGYDVPCDEVGEVCPLLQCLESGQPEHVAHVHFGPDGEEHHEVTAFPIDGEEGHRSMVLEVIRRTRVGSIRVGGKALLVGRSPAFGKMLALMDRVAPTEIATLLLGETGTGKELVAKAIHRRSPRTDQPFVPVDCSGLSESLFESEVFGHERGSFTGALARKRGLVEASHGGTLFLDEVGDVPLPLQVKLLRLLETRSFRRVGSVDLRKADFRLIGATHRDLRAMVAEGSFRADLFYRLHSFPIRIPPLRERREDLPLLIESLLRRIGCHRLKKVHPEAVEILQNYHFPGNVRELYHLLERACLLTDGSTLLPSHLPEECLGAGNGMPVRPVRVRIDPLRDVERQYLLWAEANFEGDNQKLAERLGVSERTLYRKLRRARGESDELP